MSYSIRESLRKKWLDFPVKKNVNVVLNSLILWQSWLLWTNKAMAGLDAAENHSIRSRVTSQLNVLGTVSGLFLVIAVAGFLVPPGK